MVFLNAAVEGLTDEALVRRICSYCGITIQNVYSQGGKANLDRKLPGYNNSARTRWWLILRDLDHDAVCAAQLLTQLLPSPARYMNFRIAVRELESWLMADTETIAMFLSISPKLIPRNPEDLDDPKRTLINLARRSRRRNIREDMVPRLNSGSDEGPAYASRIQEYTSKCWRPDVASVSCDSLKRCLNRLLNLNPIF